MKIGIFFTILILSMALLATSQANPFQHGESVLPFFPIKQCCIRHYVFSVDVSGSILPWVSTNNAIISNWRNWLLTQIGVAVSSHRFNFYDQGWYNSGSSYIKGAPHPWPSSNLGLGGLTNWNVPIKFLTARLTAPDHIYYWMITDVPFDQIEVDQETWDDLIKAYLKWMQYGCDFSFYILDVSNLPKVNSSFKAAGEP